MDDAAAEPPLKVSLSIAIVEDEAIVARRLERMVREILGERARIEMRSSLAGARELLESRSCEILLLDLNLNGADGFRLLEEAAALASQTIIVSAHREEALRAFEFGVVDFVAKPFTLERLRLALDRASGGAAKEGSEVRFLFVRKGSEVLSIPVASLLFLRGADDYSELNLEDGRVLLHEKSLGKLEALLPKRFLRIHRSYVLDMERLASLRTGKGGTLTAQLRGGESLPIGRSYRDEVRRFLQSPH